MYGVPERHGRLQGDERCLHRVLPRRSTGTRNDRGFGAATARRPRGDQMQRGDSATLKVSRGGPVVQIAIRPVRNDDFPAWLKLWDGYNAFYGRSGETALSSEVTRMTWSRFFDAYE